MNYRIYAQMCIMGVLWFELYPLKTFVELLTSSTQKYDLTWKYGHCTCVTKVRGGHYAAL